MRVPGPQLAVLTLTVESLRSSLAYHDVEPVALLGSNTPSLKKKTGAEAGFAPVLPVAGKGSGGSLVLKINPLVLSLPLHHRTGQLSQGIDINVVLQKGRVFYRKGGIEPAVGTAFSVAEWGQLLRCLIASD